MKKGTNQNISLLQRGSVAALSILFIAAAPVHKHVMQGKPSKKAIRIHQAKELLGRFYRKSVVKTGEDVSNVPEFVYKEVEESLRGSFKADAKRLARAILIQSHKYQMDPIF